ncbi:hypothetical protein [Pseudoxanthomonas suwonensis]|uniref:hypothetical protein n=1 Tax=Pseudoxanthomonas suwonensis TaxID=314722 RepID=UPI001E59F6B8|nr:hypothetical protein [Pseudoxanthomonas suwonensis]
MSKCPLRDPPATPVAGPMRATSCLRVASTGASAALALLCACLPALAADAAGPAAGKVTVYRCLDGNGRLVALRDSPCLAGEKSEVVQMQRPQDPPPRPAVPAPAPTSGAESPVREVHTVHLQPPRPMFECTAPDGTTYTSDDDDGNPRWVPLWTLGFPVASRPPVRPPVVPPGGSGPSPRPPHPPGNPPRPPHPPGLPQHPGPVPVMAGGSWVRDACVRLPQEDVCRRLSDRRYEILRVYHAAMPSGRAELDREQALIDERMASDCRS